MGGAKVWVLADCKHTADRARMHVEIAVADAAEGARGSI